MITQAFAQQAKTDNIALLQALGYRTIDWLPWLEPRAIRSLEDIKGRMAVLNALINISFGAPTACIKDWLARHGLLAHLSGEERKLLERHETDLTEQETNGLRWYLECLWALMWATRMMPDELDETQWCGDHMAALLPNLEADEDNAKINAIRARRDDETLFRMLDRHYRLHWFCVDERINGKGQKKIDEGLVYERRRALEWLMDDTSDWDNIEMST